MDKNMEMAKAEMFGEEKSCYIHAEMISGNLEMVAVGGTVALLCAIERIADRVAEDEGATFEGTVETIRAIHNIMEDLNGTVGDRSGN